jgi:hypothetical protein
MEVEGLDYKNARTMGCNRFKDRGPERAAVTMVSTIRYGPVNLVC